MPRMNMLSCLLLLSLFPCYTGYASQAEAADQQFTSISRLLERADAAFERHDYEEAVRLYGATHRSYLQFSENFPLFAPDLVRFRMAYCRNQMQLARQRRSLANTAVPDPQSLVSASPETVQVPARIALLLQESDIPAIRDAEAELREQGNPAADLIRAALHVKEGDFPQARSVLDAFIEQFPDDPAAHYNMAQLLLREAPPDFTGAREHYKRAREGGAPRDEDLEIVINF